MVLDVFSTTNANMTEMFPAFMSAEAPKREDVEMLLLLLGAIALICIYYEYFVSSISVFCNARPVIIKTKNGTREQSLLDLLREKCPRLMGAVSQSELFFYPTPFLLSGDFQTIWASIFSTYKTPKIAYEREEVVLSDGGLMGIDWYPGPSTVPLDNTPVVLVCHGLTGGSHETYIQDIIFALTHPAEEFESDAEFCRKKPLRCIAINCRGCNSTNVRTPRLYCAADTEDFREVVNHLLKKLPPGTPMMAIGFSMGANIVTKYAGEEGDKCPLFACCSIGNPYDLLACSLAIHRSFIGKYVYSFKLAMNLVNSFKKHMHMYKDRSDYNINQIVKARTITEFDDSLTIIDFNFRSVHEYYRKASSSQHIPDIRIPTLMISSLDDPVCTPEAIPYHDIKVNPNVILLTTDRGGHLGWYEGGAAFFFGGERPKRWITKRIAEFVFCMATTESIVQRSKLKEEEEERVKNEEREKVRRSQVIHAPPKHIFRSSIVKVIASVALNSSILRFLFSLILGFYLGKRV